MKGRSAGPSGATRSRAAIALGSNLGDRRAYLRTAVDALGEFGNVVSASPLYETAPIGGVEQGAYLNGVVVLETAMPARQLLTELHRIERAAGRTRGERWGPRTLDLDLILYGSEEISEEGGMELPHPRFRERRFVLEPLLAAWPDAKEPDGTPLAPLLAAVEEQGLIEVEGPGWAGRSATPRTRGIWWVVAQVALFVVHALIVAATSKTLGGSAGGWIALGAVGLAGSALLFLLASGRLARMLTPYPQPIDGGELVTSGVYRLARHPMYGSVILLAFSAALWLRSLPGLGSATALAAFFILKSRHEETRLEKAYPGYPAYRDEVTRRFIPWLL